MPLSDDLDGLVPTDGAAVRVTSDSTQGAPSLVQWSPQQRPAMPRPLPVGTGERGGSFTDAWPAPPNIEQTRPISDSTHQDKTAPSLFPTPEDTGKEQRPYPPSQRPASGAKHTIPAIITSSLLGLAAVAALVTGFLLVILVWLLATGRLL